MPGQYTEPLYRSHAMVLVLAIGLLLAACQGASGSMRAACGSCEAPDRMIRFQKRVVTSTNAAPVFSHPLTLRSEEWARILASVRIQEETRSLFFLTGKSSVEPLFTEAEIAYLSEALSRVFMHADPDEVVVFALARPVSQERSSVTTGKWFAQGSSLYLVLAYCRYTVTMPQVQERIWHNPLRPDSSPSYEFAISQEQVAGREDAGYGLFPVTLPSLSISYQKVNPIGSRSDTDSKGPRGSAASSGTSVSPTLEDQLRMLKRLKDDGVLTEEEYRQKKAQILERF